MNATRMICVSLKGIISHANELTIRFNNTLTIHFNHRLTICYQYAMPTKHIAHAYILELCMFLNTLHLL